jgi:hypothetical protein
MQHRSLTEMCNGGGGITGKNVKREDIRFDLKTLFLLHMQHHPFFMFQRVKIHVHIPSHNKKNILMKEI